MTAIPAIPISNEDLPLSRQQNSLLILLAVVTFAALSIWGAVSSEGFLEADAVTHYLYARFAFSEPHYFVNVWGRPLITGLYAAPAYYFGRIGVRITSLIIALLLSWTTYSIAKGQKHRWPALALIFTLAQPLVFLHSFSELTELPFALVLALAFLAYQRKHFMWMALLIGISPLGRPEGFGFIGLAGLALLLHRQWRWIPYLFVFLLCWTYAGWRIFGTPRYESHLPYYLHGLLWLKHEWPYAGESLYDRGNVLKYLALLPAVVSPLLFPAMMVGVWRAVSGNDKVGTMNDERNAGSLHRSSFIVHRLFQTNFLRCEFLIAILPFLILIGHSILHALGKMASSGELRYLLVVSPFWALLAVRGWEWLSMRLWLRSPIRWAVVLALVPCLIQFKFDFKGITVGYKTLPLTLNEDMQAARRFAQWYRAWPEREKYPRVMASHPGIFYFLDQSPTDAQRSLEWHQRNFVPPPVGVVLAWDSVYARYNADSQRVVDLATLLSAGWLQAIDEDELQFPRTCLGDPQGIFISPLSKNGATESVLRSVTGRKVYVLRPPFPK